MSSNSVLLQSALSIIWTGMVLAYYYSANRAVVMLIFGLIIKTFFNFKQHPLSITGSELVVRSTLIPQVEHLLCPVSTPI